MFWVEGYGFLKDPVDTIHKVEQILQTLRWGFCSSTSLRCIMSNSKSALSHSSIFSYQESWSSLASVSTSSKRHPYASHVCCLNSIQVPGAYEPPTVVCVKLGHGPFFWLHSFPCFATTIIRPFSPREILPVALHGANALPGRNAWLDQTHCSQKGGLENPLVFSIMLKPRFYFRTNLTMRMIIPRAQFLACICVVWGP